MEKKISIPEGKKEWEQLLLATHFSGERFIIRGKEGLLAALVPVEDLKVIEEIEAN